MAELNGRTTAIGVKRSLGFLVVGLVLVAAATRTEGIVSTILYGAGVLGLFAATLSLTLWISMDRIVQGRRRGNGG